MDFKLFFDSLDDSLSGGINHPNSLFHHIFSNYDKMPRWKEADIALFGVNEQRGTFTNRSSINGADEVRRQLYRLKRGRSIYKIADLGNLRPGETLEQTYLRIREVCEALISNHVLPVIIGASHDLDYGQYQAYEALDKLIYVLNIDAKIDADPYSQEPSACHLHHVLMHRPNYLFSFGQLAYQNYLVEVERIDVFRRLNFDTASVGEMRNSLPDIEPLVRSADMVSFDVTAIKKSDAPGNRNALPFGLTGEEACRLAWYAGLNEKLSSFGIYEYNPEADHDAQTAAVIATMLWYLIEGYYERKNELLPDGREWSPRTNFHVKYTVPFLNEGYELVFYKSQLSDKWWIEVPYPASEQEKDVYQRKTIIPCSYSDYQEATRGVLPDRWIRAISRLI